MNWQDKIYENLTEGYVDEGLGDVVRSAHQGVRKFLGKNVHPKLYSKEQKAAKVKKRAARDAKFNQENPDYAKREKARADLEQEGHKAAKYRTTTAPNKREKDHPWNQKDKEGKWRIGAEGNYRKG